MSRALPLLLLSLLALTGCSSLPFVGVRPLDPRDAPAEIVKVRGNLDEGRPLRAIDRLERLHRTRNLSPVDRQRSDQLLTEAMQRLLAGVESGEFDAQDLTDVFELELPRSARAQAGVEAAYRLYDTNHPVAAYKMVRKVERALPSHPERARAGDLLATVGFELIERSGRYYVLFRYRSRGIEALEFLVVNYPFHPSCDAAYQRLASAYESSGDLDEAIERLEDLLVYHPESPARSESEARLPALRLKRLTKDEYDRGELVLARTELVSWLGRHAEHPLRADVEATLALARRRLARSDLLLARYYARIDAPFAVRLHALRALEEAQAAGSEGEAAAARDLLARFPEGKRGRSEERLPIEGEGKESDRDVLGPVLGS